MGSEVMTQDLGALIQLHESEFDRQIATARKFPRSVARASEQILAYATSSEDVAAECNYAVPRGGKVIQGPSARLAEIVGTCWGNARYASRIIDEKEKFVVAQAVFHDLEINNMVSVEVQRSITDSQGRRYNTDMIGVTSQAAMSIAMRNAIFKGVPRFVWGDAYTKARALIAGKIESLDKRRSSALEAFGKLGANDAMVLQLLELDHVRDIEPDHLVVLRGVLTALRDGETSFRNVFGNMEMGSKRGGKADVGGAVARGREADDARRAQADGAKGGGEKEQEQKPSADPGAGEGDASGKDAGTAGAGEDASADADAGDRDHGEAEQKQEAKAPAADEGSDAPAPIESPKLDAAAAEILEREDLGDWRDRLSDLVESLRRASEVKEINAAWDRVSASFEAAPEEVQQAQQLLRSARRKDAVAASNAARSSAASKL